jgi:hypothetical protein
MRKVLQLLIVIGGILAGMPAGAVDQGKLPVTFDASTGFAFDSNANLSSTKRSVNRYQEDGTVGMYKQQANVGYNLSLTKELGTLFQYSYYQEFHFRLSSVDVLSHNFTLTPTWNIRGNSGQIVSLFNFNYMDVGSSKYKTAYTVNPTYFQMLTKKLMVEIGWRFERSYYTAPVTIPQDNRTAHTYGANFGLYYFINDARSALFSLRAVPSWNVASGSNFNGASYSYIAGTQFPIIKDLLFQANFTFTHAPYYNTWVNASVPTGQQYLYHYPKRQDYLLEGAIYATYQFYKGFYGQLQFLATRSASNIDFYNYDRFFLGGMVGYRYN